LRPVLAAVSRSLGNAVIDDIPEPGAPLAGQAVMRPGAARIRDSDCTIIPAIPAHCRVPGIIAREFRAMSFSAVSTEQGVAAPSSLAPGMPASGNAAAGNAQRGCENASTPPRARRPAATTRAPDAPAVARAGADRGARRRTPGRAAGGGSSMRSVKRRKGSKRDENVF
jgi:hypothetical protein